MTHVEELSSNLRSWLNTASVPDIIAVLAACERELNARALPGHVSLTAAIDTVTSALHARRAAVAYVLRDPHGIDHDEPLAMGVVETREDVLGAAPEAGIGELSNAHS